MIRHAARFVGGAVCVVLAVGWLAPQSRAQPQSHPIVTLAHKMAKPINFPGLENGTTLGEALDLLTQFSGVHFEINERAFLDSGGGGAALLEGNGGKLFLIAAQDKAAPGGKGNATPKPPPAKGPPPAPPPAPAGAPLLNTPLNVLPKMTMVRLETVLKRILARIEGQAPADYVLRRDGVEITTTQAKQAEFYRQADHPGAGADLSLEPMLEARFHYLPLVQVELRKTPLEDALKELADATDFTILLDPRAAEKAKAVSATLINVPLDTAVDLLANTSGLRVVQRDRALYVTTKDNSEAMQKELHDRTPASPLLNQGLMPGGIGGGLPGLGGGVGPKGPPRN